MKKRKEKERKFLVLGHRLQFVQGDTGPEVVVPELGSFKSEHYLQAYMPSSTEDKEIRVRLIDGERAKMTYKAGSGIERDELEWPLPMDAGRCVFDFCQTKFEKERFKIPGPDGYLWELDRFIGKMDGLLLLEVEEQKGGPSIDDVVLPDWITVYIEATHSFCNRHLAMIMRNLALGDKVTFDDLTQKRLPRIVLSGAPGSGKSTAIKALQKRFADRLHGMREVATQVIMLLEDGGLPSEPVGKRVGQRMIFATQDQGETVSEFKARASKKEALLLDRGTVDVGAHLPGGLKEFEQVTGVTREFAFMKYDLVIILEVPPREIYEQICGNNPARSENYEQAVESGELIKAAWEGHHNVRLVGNKGGWEAKLAAIDALIEDFLGPVK